jgi:endo-1,3(4)-beta-glucanase
MKPPVIDKTRPMSCHGDSEKNVFLVESEVELLFDESDFTWLIFVSEPVLMHCVPVETTGGIRIEVVEFVEEPDVERELVIRAAVSKLCSTGLNPVYCHQERMHPTALMIGQGQYDDQLRNHSRCFPGPNTAFDYKMEADGKTALMEFDWDVQNMEDVALHPLPRNETFLCMGFALPHHFDIIVQAPPTDRNIYCVSSLVGPACLYEGGKWQLREPIPEVNFRAPRPPAPWSISDIADSLKKDINYTLPDYYLRGAGDTYFSGKMLAKLGRILLIAEELQEICNNPEGSEYSNSCKQASLPSDANFSKALARLKSSTEIWINGTAETEFVYDVAWGGVVSCGCLFNGKHGTCDNKFPDCSAFGDPGLNFGNGFYNDQHFHYGYMIYAAAVVAHFDPAWGRDTFERVLLLIRAIANPSVDDHYFVPWRQKDWFSGHSWASGIATSVQNGKNQESSSEAIAAYEAIALYGSAMVSAWQEKRSKSNTDVAREIQHAGELLAATELRSAKMYWHVQQDAKVKIYPSAYTPFVVGILWQGMAQLQTWFGSAQHLAYGIQLLPITTISEHRDTLEWSSSMYNTFAKACSSDPSCETYGWSVLPLAILATVGHPQTANEMLKSIPEDAFESAGGNGHSLTNSLWYSATRPVVEKPLNLDHEEKTSSPPKHSDDEAVINKFQVIDCGVPRTCTDYVLDTIAGLYSCRQRIEWLMQEMAQSEQDACIQVAAHENPFECGKCNPLATDVDEDSNRPPICPACTIEQCRNPELNRCPEYKNTFVCTDGSSTGGCQNFPWELSESQCHSCCELTNCPKPSAAELQPKVEAECPVCSRETCRGSINRCPSIQGVQYLCLDGTSKGGCSNKPWLKETDASPCTKCCTLLPFCDK